MKQRPIIFSAPMVKAILEGRKTQTRRLIKSRHESGLFRICRRVTDNVITGIESLDWDERNCEKDITCPYGKPGDVLYVREEYYQIGHWEEVPGVKTKSGRMKWKFVPDSSEIVFEAPEKFRKGRHHKDPYTSTWHKRLARFMLKSAARIFLEITDIKVERVNEISEQDAIAEGILQDEIGYKDYDKERAKEYGHPDYDYPHVQHARLSFKSLWISINGEESWDSNPWVWAITFKVLSTTGIEG